MLKLSAIPLALVAGAQAALGPVTNLNIYNKHISPDGFTRSAVLAEGVFPGPLIAANKGDSFSINVINELTDNTMRKSTSIHWHGLLVPGYNWADGAVSVSQCPIAPHESFLYNFPTNGQSGTYWYHSHLSTQYCDGLRGPIVVYDPFDPLKALYDIDDENTVLSLADWYHKPAPQQEIPAYAASTLINGKGRWFQDPTAELSVVKVRKGKRYRMRLINMSCEPNYVFSIDGHMLTVIEADGVLQNPVVVDSIQIHSGQRYSFVLNANQERDNYWIRANPHIGETGFKKGINSAILRYEGASEVEPTTKLAPSKKPLRETSLHALDSFGHVPGKPSLDGADVNVKLVFGFHEDTVKFTVNGTSFNPPSVPVLLQILNGKHDATELLPKGMVYPLPRNKVIQLTMPAGPTALIGGPHPMHLHGHRFWVVRSANSTEYNWFNPVIRDTVSLGTDPKDEVTIRFKTDNAGPWFLHCHIDWHLDLGFAYVFAEDIEHTASVSPPAAWDQLCPTYYELAKEDQ